MVLYELKSSDSEVTWQNPSEKKRTVALNAKVPEVSKEDASILFEKAVT